MFLIGLRLVVEDVNVNRFMLERVLSRVGLVLIGIVVIREFVAVLAVVAES